MLTWKGIGYYTAQELARAGADVYLASRNLTKAKEAKVEMEKEIKSGPLPGGVKVTPGKLIVLDTPCDLTSFDSVRSYAQALKNDASKCDLLINNAGIMAIPTQEITKDGWETQFQSNHLGHFALTAELIPLLKKSDSPRVVNVSSGASNFGEVKVDDLNFDKRGYSSWRVYGQSKLANLYFTHELQRRAKEAGWSNFTATSAHPGWTATNLQYSGPQVQGFMKTLTSTANNWLAMPTPMGALPTLYAAVVKDQDGKFYGPDGWIGGMNGWPTVCKEPKLAADAQVAKALWEKSEEIVGTKLEM
jgi:NAD(P)-dependent dehydrogenase (short-subunit alcohol dehydrogenase family)